MNAWFHVSCKKRLPFKIIKILLTPEKWQGMVKSSQKNFVSIATTWSRKKLYGAEVSF